MPPNSLPAGFTGIISRLYADAHREWTTDIGHAWILPYGIHWKRHSCCSFAHATLEAIAELRRRGATGSEIRQIRVQAYSDAVRRGPGFRRLRRRRSSRSVGRLP